MGRWIRLDARGNKEGVNAQFALERERLAFPVRKDMGEEDYGIVYADPSDKLMRVLEESTDALYVYLNCLPDTVYDYRRAAIEDLEELVRTRITVLRVANKLSGEEDMAEVEKQSREYYRQVLETGEHTAYLVYDSGKFIGEGAGRCADCFGSCGYGTAIV